MSPAGTLQCPEGFPALGGTGACQESQHDSRSVPAVRPLSGIHLQAQITCQGAGPPLAHTLLPYIYPFMSHQAFCTAVVPDSSDAPASQRFLTMLAGLVPAIPKGEGCLRGAWAGGVLECLCISELSTMYGVKLMQSGRCAEIMALALMCDCILADFIHLCGVLSCCKPPCLRSLVNRDTQCCFRPELASWLRRRYMRRVHQ